MGREIIWSLVMRYPQLGLPQRYETKNSELYRAAVLRGEAVEGTPEFVTSENDTLELCATPAGEVPVLYLENREDFEHALRALAYRCEPREILPSVGASTISGLNNWEKIRAHKREFFASGGRDWAAEFKRFTARKENYQDTLILLSAGYYSAVPPEELGLTAETWREKSLVIRKYHELTHFVCRRLWPEQKNILRDEVYADCIGLTAAFGGYEPAWAAVFLGIEHGTCRPGGRLGHYVNQEELPQAIREAGRYMEEAAQRAAGVSGKTALELLPEIYPCR
ncbi:MAG: hypothetical protein SPI15_06890 [Candidatus Faecousia sp.]|nr:hypothetical protein [Candidatus Faecousia sp.]